MRDRRILLIKDEATTREIPISLPRGDGCKVDSVATDGAAITCFGAPPCDAGAHSLRWMIQIKAEICCVHTIYPQES